MELRGGKPNAANRAARSTCFLRENLPLNLQAMDYQMNGLIHFVMTTRLQVKGSWNEVKGKLKQKYGINR
jgi:hypothetical protein